MDCISKFAGLKDSSASYVRAKLRKYRNQRLKFPAPKRILSFVSAMLDFEIDKAEINGIYVTAHKIGPNNKCPSSFDRFFGSPQYETKDWHLTFRDVVVKFEKNGAECETYLPFGTRGKNEFTTFALSDFGWSLD